MRDPEPFRRHVLEPRRSRRSRSRSRSTRTSAARGEAAHLVGDRLRHAGDRVGAACDELRDLLRRGLPRAGGGGVVAPVLVRDERVAEIGDPARAGRLLHGGADEVHEGGGEVVITASIPSRRAMRIAAGIAVRFQVTLASGRSRRRAVTCAWTSARLEPVRRTELLGGLPRPRPEVARAVDPRLCRDAQLGVRMHPLRIVRREHVRLDAERREVLGELQRALHAASARGREVHRHEQHLHGREA